MKIFGKENNEDTLYVQVKDLRLLDIDYEVKENEDDSFIKIKDSELVTSLIEDGKIVNFDEMMNLGIRSIKERINELKDLDDEVLNNYLNDLIDIYEYKMGRKKLDLPAVIGDISGFKTVSNGTCYIISRCVDPFKIALTKEYGEKMDSTDVYPSQAIEMFIGLMANGIGLEGYVGYELEYDLSKDEKTMFLNRVQR